MAKSVGIAYMLWFFLGWLGVHQFYLKRDRHAFFTWATLGGVCGISWIRDLFHIPRYTADANDSPEFIEEITEQMRNNKKPSVSFARWAASSFLGFVFSTLMYTALWREDLNDRYLIAIAFLAHFMAALGVYIPSNEGRLQVSFKWCLLGSYLALPVTIAYGYDSISYSYLVSAFLAGYKTEWRRTPRTESFCYRFLVLTLLGVLYLGLVSSTVYYNGSITTKDGETIPLRDAVHHFFNSPAWRETKETMAQFYNYVKHHGWSRVWQEIIESLDPQGEANAYKVLGVDSQATDKDIKSIYKKLAMQWHPDRVKDPALRAEAQRKFMEIQEAYKTLSSIRQLRSKRNKTGST